GGAPARGGARRAVARHVAYGVRPQRPGRGVRQPRVPGVAVLVRADLGGALIRIGRGWGRPSGAVSTSIATRDVDGVALDLPQRAVTNDRIGRNRGCASNPSVRERTLMRA